MNKKAIAKKVTKLGLKTVALYNTIKMLERIKELEGEVKTKDVQLKNAGSYDRDEVLREVFSEMEKGRDIRELMRFSTLGKMSEGFNGVQSQVDRLSEKAEKGRFTIGDMAKWDIAYAKAEKARKGGAE